MKSIKTLMITAVIFHLIAIAGILYWYDWKLLVCVFFWVWGNNVSKRAKERQQEEEVEAFDDKFMEIVRKAKK